MRNAFRSHLVGPVPQWGPAPHRAQALLPHGGGRLHGRHQSWKREGVAHQVRFLTGCGLGNLLRIAGVVIILLASFGSTISHSYGLHFSAQQDWLWLVAGAVDTWFDWLKLTPELIIFFGMLGDLVLLVYSQMLLNLGVTFKLGKLAAVGR